MTKLLPLGIQTFAKIRDKKRQYEYVDKTAFALRMIEDGNDYYFFSRPRRFGKSLFLDTLAEIFKGSKEMFEGLYIYDKYDWEQSYPVLRIDFSVGGSSSKEEIENSVLYVLERNAQRHDIVFSDIEDANLGIAFKKLIITLYQKYNQKVVILIDEYDKPIVENISDAKNEVALQARDILKGFYAAIKASDQYVRFMFMTGVSKFSKLNLFSGLNNLEDITLDTRYATLTGYTQHDLETTFKEHFEGVDMEEVKVWYNGYNYFGDPIYNPYDILLFLTKGCEFENYWWDTGNPSFLIDKLKEGKYFLPDLENIIVSKEVLNSFDVENIDLVALLWQTGYLTFDKKIERRKQVRYKMKVPNVEIMHSLNALFFNYLSQLKQDSIGRTFAVEDAILDRDFDLLENEIKKTFAGIPSDNYRKNGIGNYEGYYASVMYALLASLGFITIAEDTTNKGRADMTLIDEDAIFIFEFKVDESAEKAIHQIEEKRYYEKYLSDEKEIFFVGIKFSSEKRNVVEMETKRYNLSN